MDRPASTSPHASVCDIIRSVGRKIGFPIPTLAMAQFLFQASGLAAGSTASVSDVAYTCLFVAGKLADTPKKLKEILGRAFTQRYDHLRTKIIHYEKEIMLALHFQFNIPLPFDFLIQLCKRANCDKRLSRHAWVLLFDMYQTSIVVRYPPYLLAMAALSLAAQIYDHEINSAIRGLLHTCKEDVQDISFFMLDFLLSTTSAEKPFYEKYRTLKISLNYQHAVPPPPPPPPSLPPLPPPPPPPWVVSTTTSVLSKRPLSGGGGGEGHSSIAQHGSMLGAPTQGYGPPLSKRPKWSSEFVGNGFGHESGQQQQQ